jgi:hypothetical protein
VHQMPRMAYENSLVGDPKLADLLMMTFNMLPKECQQEVLGRLAAVTAHLDKPGDLKPVEHFCESLVMTARAQRCAAYLRVTAEAETPGEPRDIQEVVAQIEARHRDQGA